ncbi:MAG TPA: glutaredoxin family protein [Herbaspirillum sp.]|jgi:hypothetical protein
MPAYNFTIYSRSYCHLCDDMRDALKVALDHLQCTKYAIEMVDVDADQALLAEYDELVPVLLASKNEGPASRLCHYFLDKERLAAFLAA